MYEDLKDLYDKVIPPLKAFDEEIQDISKEQEQQRQVVLRYDAILTEKASKFSVTDLEMSSRKNYC